MNDHTALLESISSGTGIVIIGTGVNGSLVQQALRLAQISAEKAVMPVLTVTTCCAEQRINELTLRSPDPVPNYSVEDEKPKPSYHKFIAPHPGRRRRK